MKYLIFTLLFFFVFSTEAWETDTYVFPDEVTETRYKSLVKELRCPKCQNQNLADSNSPIAADLRREVYNLLEQGKSDGEIVGFMVQRYGEFVLYRPQVSSLTYVLWFGPAFLLLIGVMVVVQILRKKPVKKETIVLSDEQKDKLAQILKDK
ncbi:cytochrome c-type biogenesis protein CcmH [Colwellia sp. 1_MG-2023]|uniref:cytochrome c-type biogenesis protein n=1 Tax=Colwellia sp. 1_MG-2023 TaxID=3062649 RepID=UPI0026E16BCF|nr:cytochrome c-type biogenesis protein [Colwellia sp. 1_MG-2023]MDO6447126.1 cytochrome c-type biogenesis protein CcmH [Colwellia sp. 1_MG-2023]